MLDQEKVINLTKIAIMEKNRIKKDMNITSYYQEDYVYINNLRTRISVLFIVGLGIALSLIWRIEKGLGIPVNLTEIMEGYVIPYGSVLITIVVTYTFISTLIYRKKYQEAEKRVAQYEGLLQAVENREVTKIEEEKRYANKRTASESEAKNSTAL